MIIDAHNHLGFRFDLGMSDSDLLGRMDRDGVDMAVCFSQPVVWDNAYVLSKAREHPDRIIAFAGINPWRQTAREDLLKCLDSGARGVKLHPVRDSYSLADRRLADPIFSICADRRVPILCHGLCEWSNTPWQFSEMAQRFPEVTLIMAHGGHLWLREDAIEVVKKHPNLYVESSLMYSGYIRRYVREISAERVIMGTDSPVDEFRVEMKKIEMAVEHKPERDLVMGGNIARLLGLRG